MSELIDAVFKEFESASWNDNADREIAEDILLRFGRTEPENEPLTQEELQSMNNERVWDDYNQDYALVWVHANNKVTLTFKNGGTAGGEVGIVRKIYREKPVNK